MTKTEPITYVQFLDAMDNGNKIGKLLNDRQDDRPGKQLTAQKALRKYIYDLMDTEVKPDSEEKLKEDTLQDEIRLNINTTGEMSARISDSENLESMLGEIPHESYEKISRFKEISERASGDEKKVFGAFGMWQYFEDFKKDYQNFVKEGKPLREDQQERIVDLGAKGLGDILAKKYKDKGFSEKIQEDARKIAYQAAKYRYVDLQKYITPGLESAAKEHKQKYEEIAKDSKLGTVETFSKKILKRMAASDEKEEFNLAREIIYRSSDRYVPSKKEAARKIIYETSEKEAA